MNAEAAAELLGTSTSTLSLWEARFGYPVALRSTDGEPLYAEEMMIALRDALRRELSIVAAITAARRREPTRQRGHCRSTPPERLVGSLDTFGEAQ
jgi:DNA-binding transcriptional MerR regulator